MRSRLKATGIDAEGGPAQWAFNQEVNNYLIGTLRDEGKKGGLKGVELIRDVILTTEEWSPDNGMLTPAMKLARHFIAKKYEAEIRKSYDV
ncbi:hypothetical protein IAU60_002850 [Kwoniella sp. DSM 27419]